MNCAAAHKGQFKSWSEARNHDAQASIHAIEDCNSSMGQPMVAHSHKQTNDGFCQMKTPEPRFGSLFSVRDIPLESREEGYLFPLTRFPGQEHLIF